MTSLPLQTEDRPAFFRTTAGSRVHLPDCPHLLGTAAHAAGGAELLALPVWEWSTAQIEGCGREHFDTVDDAARRVGVPVQAHGEILQGLKFVTYDDIYVVHSLTYAALGHERRIIAGFGKTYFWVGDTRVNLPDYVVSSRHGRTDQGSYADICPVHFEAMSLTGVCGSCLCPPGGSIRSPTTQALSPLRWVRFSK
jgi:hypothetical protein